jgi:hypothetical protein
MYHGMGVPGGWEFFPVMFLGCFAYLLPIAFAVFVIIYLIKINSTVEAIQKKLEQLERK